MGKRKMGARPNTATKEDEEEPDRKKSSRHQATSNTDCDYGSGLTLSEKWFKKFGRSEKHHHHNRKRSESEEECGVAFFDSPCYYREYNWKTGRLKPARVHTDPGFRLRATLIERETPLERKPVMRTTKSLIQRYEEELKLRRKSIGERGRSVRKRFLTADENFLRERSPGVRIDKLYARQSIDRRTINSRSQKSLRKRATSKISNSRRRNNKGRDKSKRNVKPRCKNRDLKEECYLLGMNEEAAHQPEVITCIDAYTPEIAPPSPSTSHGDTSDSSASLKSSRSLEFDLDGDSGTVYSGKVRSSGSRCVFEVEPDGEGDGQGSKAIMKRRKKKNKKVKWMETQKGELERDAEAVIDAFYWMQTILTKTGEEGLDTGDAENVMKCLQLPWESKDLDSSIGAEEESEEVMSCLQFPWDRRTFRSPITGRTVGYLRLRHYIHVASPMPTQRPVVIQVSTRYNKASRLLTGSRAVDPYYGYSFLNDLLLGSRPKRAAEQARSRPDRSPLKKTLITERLYLTQFYR